MEIFLQNERLHAGTNKQKGGVEEAMPVGGVGLIHKLNQQSTTQKTELMLLKQLECRSTGFIYVTSGLTGVRHSGQVERVQVALSQD